MKRNIFKTILLSACILQGSSALAQQEKAEPGKFSPTWESLSQYEVPEWFRNAKFGIWAHWGPQCQPEAGDWYGRGMYEEGGAAYKWHLEHYGHPSEFGFKDVIKTNCPSVSASTPPILGHGMKLHKEPTRKAHTQESPTMPA